MSSAHDLVPARTPRSWIGALLVLMLAGCATTLERPGPDPRVEGEGYLENGPTSRLTEDAGSALENPLEALASRTAELEAARERIAGLEKRIGELERERARLESSRLDLESALAESEAELDRERSIQRELAEGLAAVRVENVRLREEILGLKVEVVELTEGIAPPAGDRATRGSGPKEGGEGGSAPPAEEVESSRSGS